MFHRHFGAVDLARAREDDLPVAVMEIAPTRRFFDVSAYCLQRLEVRIRTRNVTEDRVSPSGQPQRRILQKEVSAWKLLHLK